MFGSGIEGKPPHVELEDVGELENHLDKAVVRWGLTALGCVLMRSGQLDLWQVQSVSSTSGSRQSSQKVAGRICSGCRQEFYRLRTRPDRGRSAVDRSHRATNRSMHLEHLTLTFFIDIVLT